MLDELGLTDFDYNKIIDFSFSDIADYLKEMIADGVKKPLYSWDYFADYHSFILFSGLSRKCKRF